MQKTGFFLASCAAAALATIGARPVLAQDGWASPADRTIPAPPPSALDGWGGQPWWVFLAYCGQVFVEEYSAAQEGPLLTEFMAFQTAATTRLQADRRLAAQDAEELVYEYQEYAGYELDVAFSPRRAGACRAGLTHHASLGAW